MEYRHSVPATRLTPRTTGIRDYRALTAAGEERRRRHLVSRLTHDGSMQKQLAVLLTVIITAAVISVTATAKDVDVPNSWRNCRYDSDCSSVVRCGSCCPDDAINKEKLNDYISVYQQECKNPRPPCPCAYQKAVCKQGVCRFGK
jgi:hypothetical protein